jgi:Holliday junction resolvase RusA-like endonuclease
LKRSLDLKIPIKAISTNKLYGGKKVRSWYYKKYRKQIFQFLSDNYGDPVSLKGNLVMEMEVGFSSPLNDASNSIKGIEDCIAEYYVFNDRQIVTIRVDKFLVDKGAEYTHVKLKGTKKNIDRRTKYVRGKQKG